MNRAKLLPALAVLAMVALHVSCCKEFRKPAVEVLPFEAATFEVEGETAFTYGAIDHTTPKVVQALFIERPGVTRIIMVDVPGSDDDSANLVASRLVREHGTVTVVPSNGVIASGGVEFLTAGEHRMVEPCGKLGVHSWDEIGLVGVIMLGNEIPRDHESHTRFLEFYREMGIPGDVYCLTLETAPPQRTHRMGDEEILLYGLVTEAAQ
jgi:hypothetical protein